MTQPILISLIVAAVLLLGLTALAVVAWRNPAAITRRVEALFRRPARPARTPSVRHYYKTYWT